jgi:small subunit ribosomal protein S13
MAEKSEKPAAESQPKDKKPEQQRGSRRPQQQVAKAIVSASGKEVRGVVRLAGKDLNGGLPIRRAIISVRGVGLNLGAMISRIVYEKLGFDAKTMLGELTEQEIEKLEHILRYPQEYGVPIRMLNRQRDLFTGNNVHMIGTDLAYAVKQDIDHEKDSYTWKGYRHTYGQKVRGQHTRSTGRTGMTVGVMRKAVLAGAAAAAQTGAAAQAAGAAAAKAPAAGAAAPKGAAPAAAPKAAAPAAKAEAKK